MAREYRIECSKSIDRMMALEMLSKTPYFRKPSPPFQEGEVWLSMNIRSDYADVRVFPRPFGFFLEITSLPEDLSKLLECWITQLRTIGVCLIVDNDTDEVVDVVR